MHPLHCVLKSESDAELDSLINVSCESALETGTISAVTGINDAEIVFVIEAVDTFVSLLAGLVDTKATLVKRAVDIVVSLSTESIFTVVSLRIIGSGALVCFVGFNTDDCLGILTRLLDDSRFSSNLLFLVANCN